MHWYLAASINFILHILFPFCIVPDLPVCVDQRGGPQCCSAQFIMDQQMMAAQNFLDGLRLELNERFLSFDMLVERLRTCKFAH